jgi:UDP-glucose 4-epimerase
MKVLITGVNGYIGNNLYIALKSMGFDVYGLDLTDMSITAGDKNRHTCDIRNEEALDFLIGVLKPDIIYHFASLLGHMKKNKNEFLQTNLQGTKNVFSVATKYKVKKIVFLSTNAVWCESTSFPVSESLPHSYVEKYGESKSKCEEYLMLNKSDVHIVILRAPIIMGPNRLGLFSLLFNQISQQNRIYVPRAPNNVIEILDISDLLDVLILCFNEKIEGEFNLGTNSSLSLTDYIQDIILRSGSKSKIIYLHSKLVVFGLKILFKLKISPFGSYQINSLVNRFQMSNTKINLLSGWKPLVDPRISIFNAYESFLKQVNNGFEFEEKSANMKPVKFFMGKLLR